MQRMKSKLYHGLFMCGEIQNIDGVTGGLNFSNWWSTGNVADTTAAEYRFEGPQQLPQGKTVTHCQYPRCCWYLSDWKDYRMKGVIKLICPSMRTMQCFCTRRSLSRIMERKVHCLTTWQVLGWFASMLFQMVLPPTVPEGDLVSTRFCHAQ